MHQSDKFGKATQIDEVTKRRRVLEDNKRQMRRQVKPENNSYRNNVVLQEDGEWIREIAGREEIKYAAALNEIPHRRYQQ